MNKIPVPGATYVYENMDALRRSNLEDWIIDGFSDEIKEHNKSLSELKSHFISITGEIKRIDERMNEIITKDRDKLNFYRNIIVTIIGASFVAFFGFVGWLFH